jgi:hypothetical protein
MLFDLNGNKYKVKFYRIQTSTFAALEQWIPSLNTYMAINICASLCNPKDKFVKSTGRKVALARVLHETPELQLTKEDRARIWETYFKEHKK